MSWVLSLEVATVELPMFMGYHAFSWLPLWRVAKWKASLRQMLCLAGGQPRCGKSNIPRNSATATLAWTFSQQITNPMHLRGTPPYAAPSKAGLPKGSNKRGISPMEGTKKKVKVSTEQQMRKDTKKKKGKNVKVKCGWMQPCSWLNRKGWMISKCLRSERITCCLLRSEIVIGCGQVTLKC